MHQTYKKIHPKFKLNGIPVSYDHLDEVSYSLIKEGATYEEDYGDFLLHWIDKEPTIEVKTSGSTGVPKKVVLKKQNMVNSALATGKFFNLEAGDTALLCLSGAYIAGKMMLVRAMVLGLELDWVEPSASPLLGTNKTYDFGALVPLQLENSLGEIDRIKTLIVGGATLSKSLKEKAQKAKSRIYETYGMTETITHIAVKKINLDEGVRSEVGGNNFNTLPNITLQQDERDCLIINAPEMNPEPIITNDIVDLHSETEFSWLGRYDNIINSGGVKLIPELIEHKLAPIIKDRYFVVGIPDKKLGQKAILLVEKKDDGGEIFDKIKALKTLEKYEVPKDMLCVKAFVETVNGKISRNNTLKQVLDS
jgi:O-succinylbenzoic acid--CoA ligase